MRARTFRGFVAAVLAVGLLGAACSGGGGDDGSSSSTEPSTTAPASCLPRSSTVARASAPEAEDGDFMLFVGSDLAQLDSCSDRMTFTFVPTGANAPPPYQVSYADEPPLPGQFVDDDPTETTTTTPPSTNADGTEVEAEPERVDVAGDAWLVVTIGNASGFDRREEEVPNVYENEGYPIEWTVATLNVVEAQMIQDIDDTIIWVIGVRGGQRPFTVDSTINPDPEAPSSTITIDIA